MPIKSTKEIFINQAINVHGNKFDYSKVVYVGSKDKVIIVCPIHGEFLQRPNDHLSGYGCKKCQYKKTSNENKFNNEIFIEKAIKIHKNKYDYSLVDYCGYENKIKIICKRHGVIEQTPHAHLSGNGCYLCKESRGEKNVANFLTNNNIFFERQVTFNDLKIKGHLFYDFYLPEYKLFIEYHGVQHWKPVDFFGGKKKFIETRNRDIFKYKYAVNNGYKIMWICNVSPKYLDEVLENKFKQISMV
jgi:very-short-patch-repair endonuclease